ncbi:hypothetical protein QE152_g10853 [Popillia japonica]|uniref:Uncharacterized protein n=1 Tax=Popillia japonica TaxID=7064 RepID=A0AAW1LP51_POPJA
MDNLLSQQKQTYANGKTKAEEILKTTIEEIKSYYELTFDLKAAEVIIDIANRSWYFSDNEIKSYYELTFDLKAAEVIIDIANRSCVVKREFLEKKLEEMVQDGTIEECESSCSPLVVVPKKEAEPYRLCVDYRKLNSITVSDCYLMPKCENLLHMAKRAPYMSAIDLHSGVCPHSRGGP